MQLQTIENKRKRIKQYVTSCTTNVRIVTKFPSVYNQRYKIIWNSQRYNEYFKRLKTRVYPRLKATFIRLFIVNNKENRPEAFAMTHLEIDGTELSFNIKILICFTYFIYAIF